MKSHPENEPVSPDALHREVHVWLVNPSVELSQDVSGHYRSLLSDDELDRYQRFRFPADQQLYLLAHVLVRTVLSRYAAIAPECWRFTAGSAGRPEILSPQLSDHLRFNLSHTHGLAACIVTLDEDCGIDVESIRENRDMSGIARRMFSVSERACLDQLEGQRYTEQFFSFWTLREAYGKALGEGLAIADRDAAFSALADGRYQVVDRLSPDECTDWQLNVLFPTRNHVLGTAVRQAQPRPVVLRWMLAGEE